jgi:hypothetical protein
LDPSRNPFLYLSHPDRFREHFDALQAYEQLARPHTLLLHPPESPDEVRLRVNAQGATLTDGDGRRLNVSGSTARTTLSPATVYLRAPIARIEASGAFWHTATALHAGGTGASLRSNRGLEQLLAGESVAPGTALALSVGAAAGTGIEQSTTFFTTVPGSGSDRATIMAARVAVHYTAAYGETSSRVALRLPEDAGPSPTDATTAGFLIYPGEGYGLGGRLDLGIGSRVGPWTFGLGMRSVLSIEHLSGPELSRTTNGLGPQPTLHATYTPRPGLALHGELGCCRGGFTASAALALRFSPFPIVISLIGSDQPRLGVSVRIPLGKSRSGAAETRELRSPALELSATVEPSLLAERELYGISLRWILGRR